MNKRSFKYAWVSDQPPVCSFCCHAVQQVEVAVQRTASLTDAQLHRLHTPPSSFSASIFLKVPHAQLHRLWTPLSRFSASDVP